MDRREDYWGNPGVIHDPDELEYGSPSDFDHHTVAHHHTLLHHHHSIQHHPLQPLHHRLDHHSSTSANVVIGPADILCGRGKTSFNHVGNKVFRNAVSVVLEDFVNAVNRFEKALIVQRVVESVQSRGGRFLKEDTRQGGWYQLSEQQSKEKVGHAIRDAANLYEVRKQKEKLAQATPQLRNTGGESDDDHRKAPEWTKYESTRGDESSVDYGVSSRGRGSISMSSRSSSYTPTDYSSATKRRGTAEETTDYEPHRKRRRTTASPTYYSSTMALSDQFLSTPSPPQQRRQEFEARGRTGSASNLRQSPIHYTTSTSNLVSSGSMTPLSRTGGVALAHVPSSLKRSPIAPVAAGDSVIPPAKAQYFHHFTVYDPKQQSTTGEAASSPEEEAAVPAATNAYSSYPHSWGTAHPTQSHRGAMPILPPFYDERSYGGGVHPHHHHRYRSYPHPSGSHVYPPPPYPAWSSYPAPPVAPHRSGWGATDPYNETRGGSYEDEEEGSRGDRGGGSTESTSRHGDGR